MGIVKVTKENFENTVSKDKVTLLDFWAEWCGPCRVMEPVMEKLANRYGDRIVFGKVNVDEEMDISSRFQVFSIPTFMIFRNGQPMDGMIGAVGEASLEQMVKRALNGQKS
jgi:thioredoxin 1